MKASILVYTRKYLGPTLERWCFLRLYKRSSALPRMTAVWLAFWNSDHVVLKSSVLPWPHLGAAEWLGSEDDPTWIFSIMRHTKQLLFLTVCDTTADNGASFRTLTRTDGRADRRMEEGQTDRRGSWNSYLDYGLHKTFLLDKKSTRAK